MKISIVMPVYNGKTTIESTLLSLLKQSRFFDEFIVKKIGHNARALVKEKYSIEVITNKTVDVFKDIIDTNV